MCIRDRVRPVGSDRRRGRSPRGHGRSRLREREGDLPDMARLRHVAEGIGYLADREHAHRKRLDFSDGDALHQTRQQGSDDARSLPAQALGVEHVLDSRSLSFAREVMALTGGAGVDIVLNSLAGEAVAAGLSALAPYGRFVEIGKQDIYQNAPIGLGPFRNKLSFAALDLERLCRERPSVVGALLARLMAVSYTHLR